MSAEQRNLFQEKLKFLRHLFAGQDCELTKVDLTVRQSTEQLHESGKQFFVFILAFLMHTFAMLIETYRAGYLQSFRG